MNIVILTSIYRDPRLGDIDTNVNIVNLFAKSWTEAGHMVYVVHNAHRYPRFVHNMSGIIKDKLAAKMGCRIAEYDCVRRDSYKDGKVNVFRLPMLKLVPHGDHPNWVYKKQIERIVSIMDNNRVIPDIILGQWACPQARLITELKKIYHCKTGIVFHGSSYNDRAFKKNIANIDAIGCRSIAEARRIKSVFQLSKLPFVCYSGVSDEYLSRFDLNIEKFNNVETVNIVFAGRFVRYKNIDVIIEAMSKVSFRNWHLHLIGDGPEKNRLHQLVKNRKIESQVTFYGRVSRDRVIDIMHKAHFFVMISKGEVYGLVYLEAMAASCITIGSRGEGIDGIIVDGKNGFLLTAGSEQELVELMNKLANMKTAELQKYVVEGYKTANNFADSKVAQQYIDNVLNYN